MTSPLDNLTTTPARPLAAEAPDTKEFSGLKHSGITRLQDAKLSGLSLEGQFDLVYNASHALCLAALRWHGYRAKHRYIVFQVLPHTLNLGPEIWRVLAKGHEVRNLGEYEGSLNVDKRLVSNLITACEAVAKAIKELPDP